MMKMDNLKCSAQSVPIFTQANFKSVTIRILVGATAQITSVISILILSGVEAGTQVNLVNY